MENEFARALVNALKFYTDRINLIVIFSIPFLAAYLLLIVAAAPTFEAIGAVLLRTGSIPELSYFDIGMAVLVYLVSIYIIAASIVNVNLVVLSKRTLNQIKNEVFGAMGTYALTIFYVFTIMMLVVFVVNLLTYESAFRTILYPAATCILSFLLFFVPPAVVIEHEGTTGAIKRSIAMALRRPHLVALWSLLGLLVLIILELIANFVLGPYGGLLVLLANSLLILPFLIILQTQLYMEKYPLAR